MPINATESTPAMPYDFTSPTATEDQLEEPAAAEGNLPGKKVGHPVSVYSEETAERVCELIATGHNLRRIEAMRATEPKLPARRTIHAWVKTRPDFRQAYYLALEERAIIRADQIIEISRNEAINVPRARHMTNVLFKLMAREAPKRYGKAAEMVNPRSTR
jgi:hypothetical protein